MRILFSFLLFTFSFASTAQIPSYVPTNGLVGYWPFNGNANDESGNGNNGVVNNCISISDRNNYSNSAYQFGNSSSINVSMTLQLFQLPTRTFSCWFRANGPQSGGRIYETSFMNGGIAFYNGNVLDTWYAYSQHCCNINNINGGSLNQWHHLASIADDVTGLTKVYLDGNLIATSDGYPAGGGCNIPSAWQWQQGFMKFGLGANNESFNGDIDDIAIYNRALTPQEITQLFTGQVIPTYLPTNGLLGWWPFNGNANDESGNGNHGVVNGATLSSDRFGNANGAYSFDGISSKIQGLSNPQLNINNNRTISVWFKSTSNIEEDQGIFGVSSLNTNGHNGYYFYLQSTGKLISLEDNWNGTTIGGPSNPTSGWSGAISNDSNYKNSNVWHHLISIKKNDTTRLYIDGVLQNINTNRLPSFNNSFLIWGYTNCNNQYFKGEIDDCALWDRALTDLEINNLTSSSNTPSTPEDTTSNVGIGTTSPKRKLHVNDVMRLEPRNTAPANPAKGDIYFDGVLNKLRVYDGSVWQSCW